MKFVESPPTWMLNPSNQAEHTGDHYTQQVDVVLESCVIPV